MAEEAKVVKRVKAKTPKKTEKAPKIKKVKKTTEPTTNYFVGAWRELRQVHWTNRKTTWKLTIAVIAFSGFFMGLILLSDWVFEKLIQETIL
jgi:preprotein translocase SecE subunit